MTITPQLFREVQKGVRALERIADSLEPIAKMIQEEAEEEKKLRERGLEGGRPF